MKKQLLLMGAVGTMLMGAAEAKAQDAVVVEETAVTVDEVKCKDIFTSGSWRDNWFVQLGAGVRTPLVEDYKNHHYTAIYNVGVGRWISPWLGFRFSGYYGSMHWQSGPMASARVANLNVDFMWDMCNSIAGYSARRPVSVVPFVGLGGTFVYRFRDDRMANDMQGGRVKRNQWMVPVSAGLQVRFRCCEYVDLFAEARATAYGDNFNNTCGDRPVDLDLSAIGGIAINFGGSGFERYNPCDYAAALAAANAQVNDLRGALAVTSAALAAAEAQLPCPEVEETAVVASTAILPTVRFKINSAYVSSEEMVNVYTIAEYLKANPDASMVICGYADKDTGSAAYNMKLSERRAQAVADILTSDYGIDPARLVLQAQGSDSQPYPTNDWNRIVVFAQPE